ncbi:protein CHUP1, chloroplastic-like [Macadamia integrifolia]|uniref:protein CHUP1, chloroplastic-like n=1 Tax=Macadamia integrifolia TaxID=60698 RepID=UPI001C530136|nr:protein CHUP1, chloroplastic-like [Macadamia integrifolia]
MVEGEVKRAMRPGTPEQHTPKHFSSSSSANAKAPTKHSSYLTFGLLSSRSRRPSPAKVQPRPHDLTDQLRNYVQDLLEDVSRLKTELLAQKLLKESAAIVPVLEREITSKDAELERSAKRIESLESDNEMLRGELENLREKMEAERKENEEKLKEMEVEIRELNRTIQERNRVAESKSLCSEAGETDELSLSQRFQGLIDASAKSNLLKSLKKGAKWTDIASNQEIQKNEVADPKREDAEKEPMQQSRCIAEEASYVPESTIYFMKPRAPRIPKPPPKPSKSSSLSFSSSESFSTSSSSSPCSSSVSSPVSSTITERESSTEKANPPVVPPPPPPSAKAAPPPPPLPPLRSKSSKSAATKVRRMPELVEFYNSMMRRDSRRDSGAGVSDVPAAVSARNMIGEIENRSAHLLAIKTDVETQGDFIRFLIKEVQNAAFTDIEDVVAFVKWLDDELSYLVDERAVLKHFDWPEQKADALREAAFGYSDLKKLEAEASSFRDNTRQPCGPALKKMQALLEKLEHGVYNLSRMREPATNRYKVFNIPSEWMLETGFVSQIKLASVKLAMKYMKRVSAELEAAGGGPEEEELMRQGVKFAFRVHQFAGGFDGDTMLAFKELKDKADKARSSYLLHTQKPLEQQQ